jgi:hypothetical protein
MKQLKKFLKQTFIVGVIFSSAAFVFIRLMVYPLPIELGEDGMIFLKTVLTGWLLVMIAKGTFEGLVFILQYLQMAVESRVEAILNKDAGYSTKNFRREIKYNNNNLVYNPGDTIIKTAAKLKPEAFARMEQVV